MPKSVLGPLPEKPAIRFGLVGMALLSLIKELRTLPDYKFTPILMLTTEAGDGKKQEGKAAGATGWIVKPFNPEQLLATIKKVLG